MKSRVRTIGGWGVPHGNRNFGNIFENETCFDKKNVKNHNFEGSVEKNRGPTEIQIFFSLNLPYLMLKPGEQLRRRTAPPQLTIQNKVTYTKHMSWDYLGHKNDHKKLSEIIQSCLDDNVENPILSRRKNQWF